MSEAPKLYTRLIKEFGMPPCPILMSLGNQWYEAPEGVSDDPNEAVSTAVFRPLSEDASATIMAQHASKWAAGLPKKDATRPSKDPVERLKQIVAHVAKK